jgi:N-acetylneuraminate lyase
LPVARSKVQPFLSTSFMAPFKAVLQGVLAIVVVGRKIPANVVLNAPFTPFDSTLALNLSVIPALAADAAASGVNVVWAAGGMGQFDSLTVVERKALAEAWVSSTRSLDIFLIIHVGTTVQADAIALAAHAQSIGADAIAAVPPYYERPSTAAAVASWLQPVAAAAPQLPFFYYVR